MYATYMPMYAHTYAWHLPHTGSSCTACCGAGLWQTLCASRSGHHGCVMAVCAQVHSSCSCPWSPARPLVHHTVCCGSSGKCACSLYCSCQCNICHSATLHMCELWLLSHIQCMTVQFILVELGSDMQHASGLYAVLTPCRTRHLLAY